MQRFLLMDKLDQEKHFQWKVTSITKMIKVFLRQSLKVEKMKELCLGLFDCFTI